MFVIAVDSSRGLLPKTFVCFEDAWAAAVEWLRTHGGTVWHACAEDCLDDALSHNDAQTANWAVGTPSPEPRARGPTMIYQLDEH